MIHNNNYFIGFMERFDFPDEAKKCFNDLTKMLDSDSDFGKKYDDILNEYMYPVASEEIRPSLNELTKLAENNKINVYSLHCVFLIHCAEILEGRYEEAGISKEIYWDSMADIKYKLKECMDCEEVPGIFVADWYNGFHDMTRFAYGRFQYEMREFDKDFTTSCGIEIKCGDKYVNFHIPSSGVSLTDDVRFDSYKRAYDAFKNEFPDGKVIFGCSSWLLYQKHREFLPSHLNILRFMDDFEIISTHESDDFSNGWRVFAKDSDLPPEKLPRNNSLQNAYADWLVAGNGAGGAFGIIVFDGEKILR